MVKPFGVCSEKPGFREVFSREWHSLSIPGLLPAGEELFELSRELRKAPESLGGSPGSVLTLLRAPGVPPGPGMPGFVLGCRDLPWDLLFLTQELSQLLFQLPPSSSCSLVQPTLNPVYFIFRGAASSPPG